MTGKPFLALMGCISLLVGASASPTGSWNFDTLPPPILIDGRFDDWGEPAGYA